MGGSGGAAAAVDGRSLRRSRNQEAVVEAMLDLLIEGHAQPTAQQISERSGVSMRSIFRLFEDMEALHRLAIARQSERVGALLRPLPQAGPVADRVEALVGNRAEVFEAISPVRRLAVRLAPRSPAIRTELGRTAAFFRDQLATVFAGELGRAGSAPHLLDALDVATSWESWERLRSGQGLSRPEATAAVTFTAVALLATARPPSNEVEAPA